MKLSPQAIKDLKKVLKKEIGEEGLAEFDDELLDDLGETLLNLTAIALKHKINKRKQNDLTKGI